MIVIKSGSATEAEQSCCKQNSFHVTLVFKAQLRLVLKYRCDLILRPLSATSLRPLRSPDWR